jgi:hypothetical protein
MSRRTERRLRIQAALITGLVFPEPTEISSTAVPGAVKNPPPIFSPSTEPVTGEAMLSQPANIQLVPEPPVADNPSL